MKILWQLLFPTRCPVCDSIVKPFGEKICLECLPKLRVVTPPWCMKCGKKIRDDGEFCSDCRQKQHMFDRSRTLYEYAAAAPSIYRFKYKGRQEYAEFFGEEMGNIWEILSAAYRRTYWYRYLCIKRSFRSGDTIRQPAWHGPWGKHAAAGR